MAVVVGFTFNAFSSQGIPVVRTAPVKVTVADSDIFGDSTETASPDPASPDPVPAALPETSGQAVFRVITLEQMMRVVNERRGMILDARTQAEYAAGHIAGAVNMYAMEPEGYVGKMAEISRDTLMIIYCSNPHCPYGRDLAEFLAAFGFSNMLLYDDGWDGWTAAGLPVVTGEGAR